jgi:magnesium-transporting ATPase (P-type)
MGRKEKWKVQTRPPIIEESLMIITILYYVMIAFVVFLMGWNLIRSKKWQEEVLYIIVLIPFLLRLLRLK